MQIAYEMTHDGPYLRIVLPEVVPPNWEALRRDVEFECGEPVTRATIVAPRSQHEDDLEALHCLIGQLQGAGASVFVDRRDG